MGVAGAVSSGRRLDPSFQLVQRQHQRYWTGYLSPWQHQLQEIYFILVWFIFLVSGRVYAQHQQFLIVLTYPGPSPANLLSSQPFHAHQSYRDQISLAKALLLISRCCGDAGVLLPCPHQLLLRLLGQQELLQGQYSVIDLLNLPNVYQHKFLINHHLCL